jgi:hypothetical protein
MERLIDESREFFAHFSFPERKTEGQFCFQYVKMIGNKKSENSYFNSYDILIFFMYFSSKN